VKQLKLGPANFLRAGIICLALLWLYGSVLWRLGGDWWIDENYSHGFLVPLISGYALWLNRDRLLAAPRRPSLILGGGLVLLAVAMLLAGAGVSL